jgi:hypothetical protein
MKDGQDDAGQTQAAPEAGIKPETNGTNFSS